MKKLILLIAFMLCTILVQAQTKQETDTLQMITWYKIDQDSVKLFYGLTSVKITNLPVEEAKKFISEKGITVSQYFSAKLEAHIYLKEQKIKKDSIQLMRIYDRIEEKLGLKKSNGNYP